MSDTQQDTRTARKAAIRARESVASPGPWKAEFPQGRDTQWFDIVAGPDGSEILHGEAEPLLHWVHPSSQAAVLSATEATKANLKFCAHARADIPWLLDELDAAAKREAEKERRCLDYENEIAAVCQEDYSLKETFDALNKRVDAACEMKKAKNTDAERSNHEV